MVGALGAPDARVTTADAVEQFAFSVASLELEVMELQARNEK